MGIFTENNDPAERQTYEIESADKLKKSGSGSEESQANLETEILESKTLDRIKSLEEKKGPMDERDRKMLKTTAPINIINTIKGMK